MFSFVFLGEQLTNRELLGCMLMLMATYIAKAGCAVLLPPSLLSSFQIAFCEGESFPSSSGGAGMACGGSPCGSGGNGDSPAGWRGLCLWGGRCAYLSVLWPYVKVREAWLSFRKKGSKFIFPVQHMNGHSSSGAEGSARGTKLEVDESSGLLTHSNGNNSISNNSGKGAMIY